MFNFRINRKLLPVKAHYFLYNAGTGPVMSFLSIYARQLGFSSVVVGIVYTILPICGLLIKPISGAFVDKFKCRKAVFIACQVVTIAGFLFVYYSPSVPVIRAVHLSCDDGISVFKTTNNQSANECSLEYLQKDGGTAECSLNCEMNDVFWNVICHEWNETKYCSSDARGKNLDFKVDVALDKTLTFSENSVSFRVTGGSLDGSKKHSLCYQTSIEEASCNVECNNYNVNELIGEYSVADEDTYHLYEFWLFLLAMIISWISQAVVVSVGDTICFELLGDKPNDYGSQRCFGSLGWGIFGTISGFTIDLLSVGQTKKNYLLSFYMGIALIMVDCIVSFKIEYKQDKSAKSIVKDVSKLLFNIRILVFSLWCIAMGMCTGLIWNFLFWLVEDLAANLSCDTQQWTKTLEGLMVAIQCILGEAPFFFFSGWIFKKLTLVHSQTVIIFFMGLKLLLYSVIKNPWYFLPVELLNGLTYGLFYACMASYAREVAPPGVEATVQGLVGSLYEGVGVSLGSLVAGILFKKYGGPTTFLIFSIGTFIVGVLHAAIQFVLRWTDSYTSYSPHTDEYGYYDDYLDQHELKLIES